MSALRAGTILAGFLALTLPLMPVQAALLRLSRTGARRFPNWYHRRVCRLLGLRIRVEGEIAADRPVLVVANHTSWLDIPLISAVAPVSFIAKREVGSWPLVSSLAKLQRTVFVDRERRTAVAGTTDEIATRLAAGEALVLFAEGTSSDGNRVLPFRTSLFAAAKPAASAAVASTASGGASTPPAVAVQTMTIAYTRLHGVPLGRADRPLIGWYGDMEMTSHAWKLLGAGPIDAVVRIGPPLPLSDFTDRKALARHTESEVRAELIRILRALPPGTEIAVAAPAASVVPGRRERPAASGRMV